MTQEEILNMVNAGIKPAEIRYYRKQVASLSWTTLTNELQTNSFALPESSRFFFGFKTGSDNTVIPTGQIDVELNGELIVEDCSVSLFEEENTNGGNEVGVFDDNYIELSRKLSGNDSLYFITDNGILDSFTQFFTVFYAIDSRLLPKEGGK